MKQWQLQEAKARFSDLVKAASHHGPQSVTVHGKPTVVILSVTEYSRLTSTNKSFIQFLTDSPLMGIHLDLERDSSLVREINL